VGRSTASFPTLTGIAGCRTELPLRPASGFRNPGNFDYADCPCREGFVVATGRGDRVVALDARHRPWHVRGEAARPAEAMEGALPPVVGPRSRTDCLSGKTAAICLPRANEALQSRGRSYPCSRLSDFKSAGGAERRYTPDARPSGEPRSRAGAIAVVIASPSSSARASVVAPRSGRALMGALCWRGGVGGQQARPGRLVVMNLSGRSPRSGFQLSFAAHRRDRAGTASARGDRRRPRGQPTPHSSPC